MRKIVNKKFKKAGLLLALGLVLSGCGKTKDTTNTETSSITEAVTTEKQTEIQTTEPKTEEVTTEVKVVDGLDITNNASIEATVDTIFAEDEEFYKENGISKNDIRNMIFIINDKEKDEDGKLLFDEATFERTFECIDTVLYSNEVDQKIDNVATVDYEVDNFEAKKQPSLVKYVDMNLSGSYVLVDEIQEYEKMRDYQVEKMNKEGKFDIDAINQYVIKNEVTDINNNSNPMSAIKGNGQAYVMASTHKFALDMAGMMNSYDTIYLTAPEYDGINTVKINLTTGEKEVIDDAERLLRTGKIDMEEFNKIVTFIKEESEVINSDADMIKRVSADYDLDVDMSNLFVAYVKADTSMSVVRYFDIRCSVMKHYYDIVEENAKTTSKDDVKKLVYTI